MDLKKLDSFVLRGVLSGAILLSPVFTVFAGVPLIALYFEKQYRAYLSAFIALGVFAYFSSLYVAIFYLVFIFVPFFVFMRLSKNKTFIVGFPDALFKVITIFAVLFAGFLLVYLYMLGSVAELKTFLGTVLDSKLIDLSQLLKVTQLTKEQLIDMLITNSLASILAFLFIFLVLNGMFMGRFIPSYSYFFSKLNYKQYRLDDLFYILGILAIAVFVGQEYFHMPNSSLHMLALNIVLTAYVKLIFLVFAFYGIMVWYSVVDAVFKIPLWQRIFFILTVISMGYFIAVIGFFDMWIDFRSFMKRRKKL